MPALLFFATAEDLPLLLQRLNADMELAFIVRDGLTRAEASDLRHPDAERGGYRRRWKAVSAVATLADGEHSLWHFPGRALPLVSEGGAEGVSLTSWQDQSAIPDPWSGWTEAFCTEGSKPYFGPGAHGEIRLTLRTRVSPYTTAERESLRNPISFWTEGREFIAASDLQWVGSRFSPAPATTVRWWNRLKRWMAAHTVRLTAGSGRGTSGIFWTFPYALRQLKAGVSYYAHGRDLDESIRDANDR